jgi:hypothetical protein
MPKFWQKLLRDVFTFSLFVLSLDEDFSSQSSDTNFILVLPMKWEQPNTVKSVFQWYQIIGEEGFYMKQKDDEREQTDGETERESEHVCACVGQRRR